MYFCPLHVRDENVPDLFTGITKYSSAASSSEIHFSGCLIHLYLFQQSLVCITFILPIVYFDVGFITDTYTVAIHVIFHCLFHFYTTVVYFGTEFFVLILLYCEILYYKDFFKAE